MIGNIIQQKPWFGTLRKDPHWSTKGLAFISPFRKAGKLVDESGNGNDGVITGATWQGQGLLFNGASDVVDTGGANFRSQDSQGTITAWIRRSASATQVIYASADTATTTRFLDVLIISDILNLGQNDGVTNNQVKGTTVLTPGQWYFVCIVSDGIVWSLYVNGVAEDVSVVTGSNNGNWFAETPNRDNSRIGVLTRTSSAAWFAGDIAYFSIYDQGLSAREILDLSINPNLPFQRQPLWLGKAPAAPAAGLAGIYYRTLLQGVS